MDETFLADPRHVAGLGRLASDIGLQTMGSYKYFDANATPDAADAGALLRTVVTPLETMRDAWRTRHVHLAVNCGELGDKLNTAAWLYSDQENRNYEALNRHTHGLPVGMPGFDNGDENRAAAGNVDDYTQVVDYGQPDGIDYTAPDTFSDDLAQVVADAAGWLGDIDDAIKLLIGHSPLQELVRPIGGNWNDLKRLGGAYRIAGEAMENGGEALAGGTARVDPSWDGMAAAAYTEYATKQIEAMKWEGACGRVVEAVAERASEEIGRSARALVETVREMVEKELDLSTGEKVAEFLAKKVSVVGVTYQLYRVYDILRTGYELGVELYESIQMGIDALDEFLSLVASPSGYMNEQFEQKIAPITKWLDRADLAKDIYRTADAGPMYEVPQHDYSLGTGDEPWADA